MELRPGVYVLKQIRWIAPFLGVVPAVAVAADYLTAEQAREVLFPEAEGFEVQPVDPAVLNAAAQRAGAPQWPASPRAWTVRGAGGVLGHVVVDNVVGKHDFITYAVGVSTDGVVRGVEIVSYRETHGGDVRNPRWRRQFAGRRRGEPLRFSVDIRNITGATLSCRHVTEGVRRVLALTETWGG